MAVLLHTVRPPKPAVQRQSGRATPDTSVIVAQDSHEVHRLRRMSRLQRRVGAAVTSGPHCSLLRPSTGALGGEHTTALLISSMARASSSVCLLLGEAFTLTGEKTAYRKHPEREMALVSHSH